MFVLFTYIKNILYILEVTIYKFFAVFIGTFRKFKEKLAFQNPSILESKVSLSTFYH